MYIKINTEREKEIRVQHPGALIIIGFVVLQCKETCVPITQMIQQSTIQCTVIYPRQTHQNLYHILYLDNVAGSLLCWFTNAILIKSVKMYKNKIKHLKYTHLSSYKALKILYISKFNKKRFQEERKMLRQACIMKHLPRDSES